MTGTIWIGDDDDKTVLLPPTSLVDNVFNEISLHLSESHSHIRALLREAYAEGTYLGLDTLDKQDFHLIAEMLFNYHLHVMITTINKQKPHIAWLPMVSGLKVALLIDKRAKPRFPNQLSVVLANGKELQVLAWCFQFFLEQLMILTSISKEEKLQILSIWANTSNLRHIGELENLIEKSIPQLAPITCLPNKYSKEVYQKFMEEMLEGIKG